MFKIGNDWDDILAEEYTKPYFVDLINFVKKEYQTKTVYPVSSDVFNAFRYTPYEKARAVILGQDPYHEEGQAHGLAFSVPSNIKFPPSLVNILTELSNDTGLDSSGPYNPKGVLIPWAKQGVLLLNTVLTVRAHEAGSHKGKGWEQFTDVVIDSLSRRETPIVFILWGANAITKKERIIENMKKGGGRHLIITAPHPSPLSAYRGFFGGRYFTRCNFFLQTIQEDGSSPIDWNINT